MADNDSYRDRLLQLIPGEAVVAYTTIGAIAQTDRENRWEILTFAIIVMTAVLPFYMWFAARDTNKLRIAVITVSFVLWASSIDSPLAQLGWYKPLFSSIPLILWTFAMPMFSFTEKEIHEQP